MTRPEKSPSSRSHLSGIAGGCLGDLLAQSIFYGLLAAGIAGMVLSKPWLTRVGFGGLGIAILGAIACVIYRAVAIPREAAQDWKTYSPIGKVTVGGLVGVLVLLLVILVGAMIAISIFNRSNQQP